MTVAALAVCGKVAWAAVITQTQTFGPAPTPWMHTFTFAGFDTSLGTLTQVSDTLTEQLSGNVVFVNGSTPLTFFFGSLIDTGSKTLPVINQISVTSISNTVFAGPLAPGASSGPLALTGTSFNSGTVTSNLGSYEGATVLGNAMDTSTNSFGSSPGTGTTTVNVMGEITDVLVYTYTPSSEVVPEPASLALLGTALAGLAFGIRRRRQS